MESGARVRLIIGRAAKAIENFDRASIKDTGLNLSDFSIMEALLHKGPLPINIIGEKVLLTSGSMTAAANRLEDRGHVKRTQDPSNRRCYYLHLTKSGRRLIKSAYDKHSQRLERVAEALSGEERGELVRLLKIIGRHAQSINLK